MKPLLLILMFSTVVQGATIIVEWAAESTGSTIGIPNGTVFAGGFEYDSEAAGRFYIEDELVPADFQPGIDFQIRSTDFVEFSGIRTWYEIAGERVETTDQIHIRLRNEVENHTRNGRGDFLQVFSGIRPSSFFLGDPGPFFEATLLDTHRLPTSLDELVFTDLDLRTFGSTVAGATVGKLTQLELRVVPEPATCSLLGLGCLLGSLSRRRRIGTSM